jgi:hypothetical protein
VQTVKKNHDTVAGGSAPCVKRTYKTPIIAYHHTIVLYPPVTPQKVYNEV